MSEPTVPGVHARWSPPARYTDDAVFADDLEHVFAAELDLRRAHLRAGAPATGSAARSGATR